MPRGSKLKPEPDRPSEPKLRKCLKCAKEFLSEYVGERICPMCKVKKGWCWGNDPGTRNAGAECGDWAILSVAVLFVPARAGK